MKSLKSQFLYDLEKVYDAEYRIAKALPKLIKPDTSEDLKQALLSHAKEIAGHVTMVEQLLQCFGQPCDRNAADAAARVVADHDECIDEIKSSLVHDAALVSALKMVKHGALPSPSGHREWEIASYGCLHEWAMLLGNAEGAELLERILDEDNTAKRDDPNHSLGVTVEAM